MNLKLRKQKTIRPDSFHIDNFIDKYFDRYIDNKDKDQGLQFTHRENDQQVHKLIHNLLVMGEKSAQLAYHIHLHDYMLRHQEMILAVKD